MQEEFGASNTIRNCIDDGGNEDFQAITTTYLQKLHNCFDEEVIDMIGDLARALRETWKDGGQVFICGNGGSAANAIHIANDLHYGVGTGKNPIAGIRVEALSANTGILTCLANDTGYENIYSKQLEVKANKNDVLIVLSGSGNSQNVINAIKIAKEKEMISFAILAYDGGICKSMAQNTIHFKINDMQIAEDTQLIVGHLCMQWLNKNKP